MRIKGAPPIKSFDPEITRLTLAGESRASVAGELGISERSVQRRRLALGLPNAGRGRRQLTIRPEHVTAGVGTRAWFAECDQGFRRHITALRAALIAQEDRRRPAPRPALRVLADDVVVVSSRVFAVPAAELCRKHGNSQQIFARQVAMHVATTEFLISKTTTAKALKHERTVVAKATRKIRDLREIDFDLEQKIETIAALARERARRRQEAVTA